MHLGTHRRQSETTAASQQTYQSVSMTRMDGESNMKLAQQTKTNTTTRNTHPALYLLLSYRLAGMSWLSLLASSALAVLHRCMLRMPSQ